MWHFDLWFVRTYVVSNKKIYVVYFFKKSRTEESPGLFRSLKCCYLLLPNSQPHGAALLKIWAETKKTTMTMLHYWQFARLNLFNSSRLYDPRVNSSAQHLQSTTQQIETEVRRGGRGGHSPWERGCMAWRACRAYRRCWAAHGDTDGEGHLVTTSAWRRARPLRLYGKPIWGDGQGARDILGSTLHLRMILETFVLVKRALNKQHQLSNLLYS